MLTVSCRTLVHSLEGGVLVGLDGAHHAAVILLGEEALRDANEEKDIQTDGGEKNDQGQERMAQHDGKRAAVISDHPIEAALGSVVQPAVLALLA